MGGSQKENKSIHPAADAENVNVNTSEGRGSIQEHDTGESMGFVSPLWGVERGGCVTSSVSISV